jgi:uncharacterized protein
MIWSVIPEVDGFDWDAGNKTKNWDKHLVKTSECEEVFFNEPYIVNEDISHSQSEQRYFLLGVTNSKRMLFVVFTIRSNRIRVISARDMSRKEKIVYGKLEADTEVQ